MAQGSKLIIDSPAMRESLTKRFNSSNCPRCGTDWFYHKWIVVISTTKEVVNCSQSPAS